MLFFPKSSKFKKYQKGIFPNKLNNNCNLKEFLKTGSIKLIAGEFGDLTAKQLIATRFLIKKFIKKKGLLRFNVYPQKAITKKPSEIRMGKGKGPFSHWVVSLKAGVTICEILCRDSFKRKILKILKKAQIRLPIKTKIYF